MSPNLDTAFNSEKINENFFKKILLFDPYIGNDSMRALPWAKSRLFHAARSPRSVYHKYQTSDYVYSG